jgi:DNA-binding transcriptional regulator YhcF (GntR family)
MSEENQVVAPGRKKLPTAENSTKLKNYATAIGLVLPALSGLVLGVIANVKGEPVAEKTWETLSKQVNRQSIALKRLHSRMVYFQAHEEGRHSAEIQIKLDALQKQYDALKAKAPVKMVKGTGRVVPATQRACRQGYVEADGKCRRAARAVVQRVVTEAKAAASARKRLIEAKRRTTKLEHRLRQIRQEAKDTKALPALRPLPKKLDDVADRK